MANRYWVGNGGSWDDTAHWASTSGGAGGVSVPTSADNVFINSASFSADGHTILLASATSFNNFTSAPDQSYTFTTNGYSITGNKIDFATNFGGAINLGASVIRTGSWRLQVSSVSLTFNAGTSHIIISAPFSSYGIETNTLNTTEVYYDLTIQGDGTANPVYVGGAFYVLGGTGFSCNTLTFANGPLLIDWRDFQAGVYNTAYSATSFVANGSSGKLFTFYSDDPGEYWKISATTASVSYCDVTDSKAGGAGVPFMNMNGGVDGGGNSYWCFPTTCSITSDYNTSLISAVSRVQQNLPFPQFVIGGQGGVDEDEYVLFKKTTTMTYSTWRSKTYEVGKDFDVLNISLPLITDLAAGTQIVPVLYFDDGDVVRIGTSINNTNYANTNKLITLTAKDFGNAVRGKSNFFLELQFTGTALATVGLPIFIDLDILDT